MENRIKRSVITICELFDKYDLDYILVGGVAVALNGYFRFSVTPEGKLTDKPDIDIWYNPTYENYFKILKIIEELGQDITEFKEEKDPNPRRSFFKLEFEDFTLDILPEIKTKIKFSDANKRKEGVDLGNIKVYYLSYLDLIEDKKATARDKDIEDIEYLLKIRSEI